MVRWDHGNDQAQEDAWEERLTKRVMQDPDRYVSELGTINAQSMNMAERDEIDADHERALGMDGQWQSWQ